MKIHNINISYTIAGPGVSGLDIDNKVINLVDSPSDAELQNFYQQNNYYFLLSSYEGFGISTIEAMSFGLIPILSDIPIFKKHVQNSLCGMNVSLSETDQILADLIANYILSTYKDSTYPSMNQLACNYSSNFSPENWKKNILDFINV